MIQLNDVCMNRILLYSMTSVISANTLEARFAMAIVVE